MYALLLHQEKEIYNYRIKGKCYERPDHF